jgi:hypothetical protein
MNMYLIPGLCTILKLVHVFQGARDIVKGIAG